MCPGPPPAFAGQQLAGCSPALHPVAPPPPNKQFINNIVHDIEGAGFGAYGCYGCLYAHNTLVRVGARSHTVEVELGGHGCDGG